MGDGLLYQRSATSVAWRPMILAGEDIGDEAAWYIEYHPSRGNYAFRNAATGKYLSHASSGQNMTLKTVLNGQVIASEYFQLMPDRTDVTLDAGTEVLTTHGYWFTWSLNGSNIAMQAAKSSSAEGGLVTQATFDFSDKATAQQWIIFSEEELKAYQARATAIGEIRLTPEEQQSEAEPEAVYSIDGKRLSHPQRGLNIIRFTDGKFKKTLLP